MVFCQAARPTDRFVRTCCTWADALTPPWSPVILVETLKSDPSSQVIAATVYVAASLLVGLCLFVTNAYHEPHRRFTHFLMAWPAGFAWVGIVGYLIVFMHLILVFLPFIGLLVVYIVAIALALAAVVVCMMRLRDELVARMESLWQKFIAWVRAVDEAVAPAKPKEEEKKEPLLSAVRSPENEL